jgi:hypothetical protein
MAEPRDPSDESESREPKPRAPRPRRRRAPSRDRDRDRCEEGDDPRAHAQILERRWLGSSPPTAELYARALQQWRALPGAVMAPATSVTSSSPPAPAGHADTIGGE